MKSHLIKITLLTLVALYLGMIASYAIDKLPEDYYARLEGKVTDSEGEPLMGVKVFAFNEKLGGYSALTDIRGNYILKVPSEWKSFPGTPYKIFISKEGYPTVDDSLRLIRQKAYNKNYSLNINKDYLVLKGVVYCKGTRVPIEGAKVTLKPKGSNKITGFSDSNQSGEFNLYLLDNNKFNIFRQKSEYILAAGKEDYVSYEKAIVYEEDLVYRVYLDDVLPPSAPYIETNTFITNKNNYELSGTKEPQTCLYVNKEKKIEIDNKASWACSVSLDAGENVFNIYLIDVAGNKSPSKKIIITKDVKMPVLLQITPENHSVLDSTTVNISGVISDNSTLKSLIINNRPVAISSEGVFNLSNINLNTGKNLFIIVIEDIAGNKANYGYELFSQIYVEGENIENRKVNQPEIPL